MCVSVLSFVLWEFANGDACTHVCDLMTSTFIHSITPLRLIPLRLSPGWSTVCFTWVRGHNGVRGNERVDELAKAASSSTETPTSTLQPISYIKKQSRQQTRQNWNTRWTTSTTGSLTRDTFFPTIHDRLKSHHFKPTFITTQFFLDMGNLELRQIQHSSRHRLYLFL